MGILAVNRHEYAVSALWMAPSRDASLDCVAALRRMTEPPSRDVLAVAGGLWASSFGYRKNMATATQRFEQEIGGRLYVIETSAVQVNRWRAQIARRPGMPSALMPFYGSTPADAASQLVRWLTRAHAVAPDPAK